MFVCQGYYIDPNTTVRLIGGINPCKRFDGRVTKAAEAGLAHYNECHVCLISYSLFGNLLCEGILVKSENVFVLFLRTRI